MIKDCWNKIGVWGDRSCSELNTYTHCRNCPVYSAAGRNLLEREAPEGYLKEWTNLLTEVKKVKTNIISVVVFRLGVEWLALPSKLFKEVTQVSVIHTLPHRRNPILLGVVNIRGEIQMCVSLNGLLGIEVADASNQNTRHLIYKRMVVVEKEGNSWVFPIDEVYGVCHFYPDELRNVPASVSKSSNTYTKGMVNWQEKNVSLLDEELLFYTLDRKVV